MTQPENTEQHLEQGADGLGLGLRLGLGLGLGLGSGVATLSCASISAHMAFCLAVTSASLYGMSTMTTWLGVKVGVSLGLG